MPVSVCLSALSFFLSFFFLSCQLAYFGQGRWVRGFYSLARRLESIQYLISIYSSLLIRAMWYSNDMYLERKMSKSKYVCNRPSVALASHNQKPIY